MHGYGCVYAYGERLNSERVCVSVFSERERERAGERGDARVSCTLSALFSASEALHISYAYFVESGNKGEKKIQKDNDESERKRRKESAPKMVMEVE